VKGKRTEPFVMLPLSLVESAAFRSLSINGWRFIRFLMAEHMRHAGKANGLLLAPRRQLRAAGIGSHHVSPAIEETERLGLVDCRRGVGRQPSVYALTWLPMADGTEPSNRWRRVVMSAEQHSLFMSAKQHSLVVPNGTHKGSSECQTALTKPKNSECQTALTYKKASYRGGETIGDGQPHSLNGAGAENADVAARPTPVRGKPSGPTKQ